MQNIEKGAILDVSTHIKAWDEKQTSYWVDGPVLILDTNEYDVTFLSGDTVLYSSWQELAIELELYKEPVEC